MAINMSTSQPLTTSYNSRSTPTSRYLFAHNKVTLNTYLQFFFYNIDFYDIIHYILLIHSDLRGILSLTTY